MYKFTALVFLAAAVLHPAHGTSKYVPADVRAAVYETLAILAAAGFVWCLIETIYRSFAIGGSIDSYSWIDRIYRLLFPAQVERTALKELTRSAKRHAFDLLMNDGERRRLQILAASTGAVWGGSVALLFIWVLSVMLGVNPPNFYNVIFGTMVSTTGVLTHALGMFKLRMRDKYGQRYETEFETVPLYDQKQRLTGVAVRSRITSDPVHTIARESA